MTKIDEKILIFSQNLPKVKNEQMIFYAERPGENKKMNEKTPLNRMFSLEYLRTLYSDSKAEVEIQKEGSLIEKRRLNHLINKVAKSETGREVLEKAAVAGYTVVFEAQKGSHGFCDDKNKVLSLNPASCDEDLIATLAHEGRHAQQYSQGALTGVYSPKYDMATQLKERRLMEADAFAVSVAVAKDIALAGDNRPLENMRSGTAGAMVDAYEANMKAGKKQALTETVMAFYDTDKLKTLYEYEYVLKPLSMGRAFSNMTGEYSSHPVEESIAKICTMNNAGYFTRPAADLNTPERAGISGRTAEWIAQYAQDCDKVGTEQTDPTLEKLPVYQQRVFALVNLPDPITYTYPIVPPKERPSYYKNPQAAATAVMALRNRDR